MIPATRRVFLAAGGALFLTTEHDVPYPDALFYNTSVHPLKNGEGMFTEPIYNKSAFCKDKKENSYNNW